MNSREAHEITLDLAEHGIPGKYAKENCDNAIMLTRRDLHNWEQKQREADRRKRADRPQDNIMMTIAQVKAVHRKYQDSDLKLQGKSFIDFLETVQPTFGCDDAVVFPWNGMWIIVETDGYAHS